MHEVKTYAKPPSIPTHRSPDEILGVGFNRLFTEHYRAAYKSEPDAFRRDTKAFSVAVKSKIAAAYEELRRNGYYPGGLDDNGNIKWRYTVDSRPDSAAWREIDNTTYTMQEIGRMRKEARANLNSALAGEIKTEPEDYDHDYSPERYSAPERF